MKRHTFRSIDEVLGAGLFPRPGAAGVHRVLKSTRLEDIVYKDLREGDAAMDAIDAACLPKLSTFDALARDVYQSFYPLNVRRHEETELSDTARRFNSHILDGVMGGDDYPSIKAVCEGRQLPAYEASSEFVENISNELDILMEKAGDQKNVLNTLDKLRDQETQLFQTLEKLLAQRGRQTPDAEFDWSVLQAANKAVAKARQVEAVGNQVKDNLLKNGAAIGGIVAWAVTAAKEKAEDAALALAVWGQGESNPTPEKLALDRALIDRIRNSPTLKEVTRFLGRFKEIAAQARKNSYAYGRGEKYTLELGNDLDRVVTSGFSLLALPETIPLFLRKYQNRKLPQYKRREAIYKGAGDIIVCLDESGSAQSQAPWGKAVALALLDASMMGGRKFALIHFSSAGRYKTDLFLPGQYSIDDLLQAAETFLGGNTDFETPLTEAMRLMEQEGFEKADVVFVTDGECELPEGFCDTLKDKQAAHGFTVTGVLLDADSPGMAFSLTPFCSEIYRVSELAQEKITEAIIKKRV